MLVVHLIQEFTTMATTKPRATITFEPELYQSIKRLCALRGVSMSQVINEFMLPAKEILDRTSDVLQRVESVEQEAVDAFMESMLDAEGKVSTVMAELMAAMDSVQPPHSNTGVTPPTSKPTPLSGQAPSPCSKTKKGSR